MSLAPDHTGSTKPATQASPCSENPPDNLPCGPFDTITVDKLEKTLSSICDIVVKHRGRIEIVACGLEPDVVLISKHELAHLDHALEILSHSKLNQQACRMIKKLAESDLGDCSEKSTATDGPNLGFLKQLLR